MKKSKIILILVKIIIVLGILIGISYAWWSAKVTQKTINKITSDCLRIEIEDIENSAINLEKAYPITDIEASHLKPYTFKIKNECNREVEYSVNLEIMESNNQLPTKFLNIDFNGEGKKSLIDYQMVEPSYKEDYSAIEARHLINGILNKKGEEKDSIVYTMKLWIDENVTIEDNIMNKEFIGKISILGAIPIKVKNTLIAANYSSFDTTTIGAFWDYKTKITKIVFEPTMQAKKNADYIFDVSEEQDGSVISYLVPNAEETDTYVLYIQFTEKLFAPENCTYLFAWFNKLEAIEGLEYFDTSNVINMEYMFAYNVSISNLDLSAFDTSNVSTMRNMFALNYELIQLNVSNWNTKKVKDIGWMFYKNRKLTSLDLNNWDTTNLETMDVIFYDCVNLIYLDISNFNNSSIISDREFAGLPSSAKIKVKNKEMKDWVLNTTSRPPLWTANNIIIV